VSVSRIGQRNGRIGGCIFKYGIIQIPQLLKNRFELKGKQKWYSFFRTKGKERERQTENKDWTHKGKDITRQNF